MNLKPLAKKYFEAVNKYDQDLVSQLTTTEYIQHNPNVESGQKAFLDLLPILKSHNAKIINQRIIQDGQFIIMHHKWVNAKPMGGDELSAFHIIRFNSENKIAEHWNVASTSLDFEGPLQTNESGVTLKNKSLVSSLYKDKKVHRIFGEENFILVIFEDEGFAKYELHFVENQRSTRSWKIHQKIPTENLKNQNTMFNFPTSD